MYTSGGGMSGFDEQSGELEIRKVLERHGIEPTDLLIEEICNVRRLMPAEKYPTPIKVELKENELAEDELYDITIIFSGGISSAPFQDEYIKVSGWVRGGSLANAFDTVKKV